LLEEFRFPPGRIEMELIDPINCLASIYPYHHITITLRFKWPTAHPVSGQILSWQTVAAFPMTLTSSSKVCSPPTLPMTMTVALPYVSFVYNPAFFVD